MLMSQSKVLVHHVPSSPRDEKRVCVQKVAVAEKKREGRERERERRARRGR